MDCDLYYFSFHLAFEDLKHLTCFLVANSFSPDDFLYYEFLAANYYRPRRFASLVALIKSKLEPRFFFLFFHTLTHPPVIANVVKQSQCVAPLNGIATSLRSSQ